MVAAVKSTGNPIINRNKNCKFKGVKRTSNSLLKSAQELQGSRATVQCLDVGGIQLECFVAVLYHLLVFRRNRIDIT